MQQYNTYPSHSNDALKCSVKLHKTFIYLFIRLSET